MKDYSHLKGKELWCVTSSGTWQANDKKKAKGFLAEIDYRKGITIKHVTTQEDLICLNRKDLKKDYGDLKMYRQKFEWYISQIEKGFMDGNKRPWGYNGGYSSNCAFE